MAIESPLVIIFEMIRLLIVNAIQTMIELVSMFLNLVGSLGFLSAIGGVGVLVLSVIIIAVVVFFLGKFVLKSWKGIILLGVAGIIVMAVLFLGAVLG